MVPLFPTGPQLERVTLILSTMPRVHLSTSCVLMAMYGPELRGPGEANLHAMQWNHVLMMPRWGLELSGPGEAHLQAMQWNHVPVMPR